MSTPPHDPNQSQELGRKPDNEGNQGQPAYGYQSAQPSTYGYPGGQSQLQQPGPISRPSAVAVAFWLIIASIVLQVVEVFLLFSSTEPTAEELAAIEEQLGANNPMLSPDQLQAANVVAAVIYTVMVVIAAVVLLISAFQLKAGKNWARILGTVFLALAIGSVLFHIFGLVVTAASIAAIVFLFLPASNNYFKAVKAQKYGVHEQ